MRCKHFIERILDSQEFIADLEEFVAQILLPGRINSLTQTLIKCTAPGVPDTYQGSEFGIFTSSIPTIAGQSIMRSGARCSPNLKPA